MLKILPKWLVFFIILGITGSAYIFGIKFKEQVQAYGTAFVGSALLVQGSGHFIGKFPQFDGTNVEFSETSGAYFVSFLVLTAAGFTVQYKFNKKIGLEKEATKLELIVKSE